MTDQPKQTPPSSRDLNIDKGKSEWKSINRFYSLLSNSQTFLPLLSGIFLMVSGLTLVSLTILGLITPLWLSGVLSLFGSICSMVGAFLVYQTATTRDTFETLVTRAIRRAINSQN